MPIYRLVENGTYQHQKVLFDHLDLVLDFGPAGGKTDLIRAPGDMNTRTESAGRYDTDRISQVLDATREEEIEALREVRNELASKWIGREYNAVAANCINFVNDVFAVSERELGRDSRMVIEQNGELLEIRGSLPEGMDGSELANIPPEELQAMYERDMKLLEQIDEVLVANGIDPHMQEQTTEVTQKQTTEIDFASLLAGANIDLSALGVTGESADLHEVGSQSVAMNQQMQQEQLGIG